MKKLALLAVLCFAVMAAIPAVSLGGKGGLGTEDSCAASFGTEDASACGGYIIYSFYARYPKGAFAECWYEGRNAANGQVVNYIVNTVPWNQSCPSSP